ncbi:MAG: hypothetical protein Q8P22_01435 [Chloroflexota bacterium]|nr:hypothetical protein [Chloroflexota bacterium]
MAGPARTSLPLVLLLGLLAVGIGLPPQGARADEPIGVQTRAEVVGTVRVTIDIEPGSHPNSINLQDNAVIPVAVLTTASFDPASLDPATVMFAGGPPTGSAPGDVDDDGNVDLVFGFTTQEVSIQSDATQACLQGTTYQGVSVQGCDSVSIVSQDRPAGGGLAAVPTATSALAAAALAATAIDTLSPSSASGDTLAATPRSQPLLPPATGAEGGLGTDGWPWLILLAGGGFALGLVIGLAWLLRPRRL